MIWALGLDSGPSSSRESLRAEDPDFLRRQLVTYLGNKRALVPALQGVLATVRRRLGGRRLRAWDAFSGSGVVARSMKLHAEHVIASDLEPYAGALARCFLRHRSRSELQGLKTAVLELNRWVASVATESRNSSGFIEEMYAPRDDAAIQMGERAFYTRDNARRLDAYCQALAPLPADVQDGLRGPLLARASVHANTAGVFKGFYKDRETGRGRFGGSGEDALSRIQGRIELEVPVQSRFPGEVTVHVGDANALASELKGLDVAYLDPPYNQHPYGSNYFMLNLLVRYQRPAQVSPISGIPTDWQRSGYNRRSRARGLLEALIDQTDAPFIIVSYGNEGFISFDEMNRLLRARGRVSLQEVPYPTFRGSRNLSGRALYVMERIFLLER